MLHTNHQQRRILAFPAAILEFGWNPVSPTASKHSIMPSIPVVIYLLVLELLQMGADSSPKLSRFDLHGCTFGSHPLGTFTNFYIAPPHSQTITCSSSKKGMQVCYRIGLRNPILHYLNTSAMPHAILHRHPCYNLDITVADALTFNDCRSLESLLVSLRASRFPVQAVAFTTGSRTVGLGKLPHSFILEDIFFT